MGVKLGITFLRNPKKLDFFKIFDLFRNYSAIINVEYQELINVTAFQKVLSWILKGRY